MLLGFVGRVIIVRYTTQTEYGIYALTLVLMSIFVTISTLGVQEESTRYIAYFIGRKKVFFEIDENGRYVVECTDLPGCLSEGETLKEAIENISEAIVAYYRNNVE